VLVVVVALMLAPAPAGADHDGVDVPWTDMLPPLATAADPQPGPVEHCRRARVECVERAARRMARMRDRFGCDHRAIFPVTYWHVTTLIAESLRAEPDFFDDPEFLIYEAQLFANYFYRAYRRNRVGLPAPPAWQIAFDAWAQGDTNAAQDMLLGINAHVQRDMPFVLAELGLRTPGGASRKPDHDRENEILNRAYDPIVAQIGAEYDPLVEVADGGPSPVDDIMGLQLVRGWREGVWRNAERLLDARGEHRRARVARSIELNAATWARTIAAFRVPGYGASRDAYCAASRLREPANSAGASP